MVKVKILLILGSLLLLVGACSYQNIAKIELKSGEECDLELFMCLNGLSEIPKEIVKNNNLTRIFACNVRNIDSDNDGLIEEEKIRSWIERTFPDRNQEGYGVLDLEGKVERQLHRYPRGSKEFLIAFTEFKKALTLVQELRPRMKWGFYGLPFRDYWNRNEGWYEQNAKIEEIFQQSDVIYPSVYDFFKTSGGQYQVRDSLYVHENVLEALKYGKKYKKEVLPFIWHRYHNSSKTVGLELIPWIEMEEHISAALSAEIDGTRVSGLVWWGDDQYFYNIKNPVVLREVRAFNDYESYLNSFVIDYLINITDMLSDKCDEIQALEK